MRQHGTCDKVSNGIYGRNIGAIGSVDFNMACFEIRFDSGFGQPEPLREGATTHADQQPITGYGLIFVF